ncbi:NlpC/P60 family protein [Streptomyces sp. NPDC058579]|uniref:C40 family peptidase n=1 Tax=Streptomyces sp. NPDC058579 TaxID=3346548 RepID=UPI003668C638
MRSAATVTIGLGATIAVALAALAQAASGNGVAGAALSVHVPAQYRALIEDAGTYCPEVPPDLLAALIQHESSFNPGADSGPAKGIAQFRPGTFEERGIDGNGDGKRDLWDPEDAIPSAAKYLCEIYKELDDVPGDKQSNMLAAYNAGPGAVREHGGVPPYTDTQNYVRNIQATIRPGGGVGSSKTAAVVIGAASKMIGLPYSWGGGNASGPTNGFCCSPNGRSGAGIRGFDCSGLVVYAYAKTGVSLPRTAAQQYAASEHVSPRDLRPGDLVFYGTAAANIHHVGIYIGDGLMINAPRPGTDVRTDPIKALPDLYAIARPVPKKEI